MNKTISVNIGGRVFNIEEVAYDKLNNYLKTIRGYFEGNESTDEIISDIELRIAELFMDRITLQKQVIVLNDVNEVIAIMGKPEDYITEEEEEPETYTQTGKKTSKQVFRDPDNKIVFGVCGGLGAYFGIDPLILRLLFVILAISYGSGFIVYILLALIIPKAKTTAEKLQMRGEPVTVENISKKVNESFSDLGSDIKDFGKKNNINKGSMSKAADNVSGMITDFFNFIGKILSVLLVIFLKVIGTVLLLLGISGIVFTVALILGWDSLMMLTMEDAIPNQQLEAVISAAFGSGVNQTLFGIGSFLVMITPSIAFILIGIRLLFDFRKISGSIAIALIILWCVGLGMLAASGFSLFREFAIRTSFTETEDLAFSATDTLVIALPKGDHTVYSFESGWDDGEFFYDGSVTFPGVDSTDILYIGKNRFTVEMNQSDTTYQLKVKREAQGASSKEAIANARSVVSEVRLSGDTLRIHPNHVVLKGAKIRGQRLKYILEVPVGKAVKFTYETRKILDDVDNVTHTHDNDMVNQTWIMTSKGLKCVNCPEIEATYRERYGEELEEEVIEIEETVEELPIIDEVEAEVTESGRLR